MSNITVRQAVLTDIEALVPLFDSYRQFYGRPSDIRAAREFLLARFNHGELAVFIAHKAAINLSYLMFLRERGSDTLFKHGRSMFQTLRLPEIPIGGDRPS
jgi:hypothetical protein